MSKPMEYMRKSNYLVPYPPFCDALARVSERDGRYGESGAERRSPKDGVLPAV